VPLQIKKTKDILSDPLLKVTTKKNIGSANH